MSTRIVTYEIEHCNDMCPYFYYNFDDCDNIWCSKLNKRIYICDDVPLCGDYKERPIPEECPLERSNSIKKWDVG